MFYGVSKNKNGKEVSDIEQYTPWHSENFSGKIKYELDNEESYEVYREFKKKNPKIFNKNSEDISKNFSIDKTRGNLFFYEQTNLDEELFLSSLVSLQQEVKLDQKTQNTLIQKISNLINTGEDNVSYQKTIKKLDKRLLEEIGTLRSQDRPINIIQNRISEIEKEIDYLQPHILQKYEISQKKEEYNQQSKIIKQKIDFLSELKALEDSIIIEKEKIEANKRIEKDYINKLENLNKEINNRTDNKIKYNKKISPIIPFGISIIVYLLTYYLINNVIVNIPIFVLLFVLNVIYIFGYNKNKSIENKEKKKITDENLSLKKEIDLTEKNIKEQELIINKMQEELDKKALAEREKIKYKYKLIIEDKNNQEGNHNIIMELNSMQEQYQNIILKIKTLELEEKDILPRIDKLAGIEEELEALREEKEELETKKECIEKAKEYITLSYTKMKNEISPKFADNISKQMKAISNGKYKNIKINDENGFMVEIENGNYINGNSLSAGTIDQLYLSLRLSVIDDISSEKMPILLDETFAYFDDERLENVLQYLHDNYCDRQIIIFTCTTREKEALNKLNIKYNLIEM